MPAASRKDARAVFSHVYQDTSGRFKKREVGSVHAFKRGKDDGLTLNNIRFEVGDAIALSIYTSHRNS